MRLYDGEIEIEGLDPTDPGIDLPNDTNPGEVQTRFSVEKELMPFLSEEAGRPVYRNFVHVERKWHLGAFVNRRRINDEVEFDETTQRWKVKRLNPATVGGPEGPVPVSDIKRNPKEWNAFSRGASQDDIGTPLELLFKNDPAKVEQYKYLHIRSLEALASLTDKSLDQMPMGSRYDRDKARTVVQRMNAEAPQHAINNKLEEKDRQIEQVQKQNASMSAQIAELTAKLSRVLETQITALSPAEAPKKRTRKAKETPAEEAAIVEG